MSKRIAASAASLFLVMLSLCTGVIAAPQTGWWWNPAESGRGFFVESHDGITSIGAYFYDTDGHALWAVSGGPNADPYNFRPASPRSSGLRTSPINRISRCS